MLKALITGFKDGFDQPYEFGMGMTYESDVHQYVYDLASILGQRVARVRRVFVRPNK